MCRFQMTLVKSLRAFSRFRRQICVDLYFMGNDNNDFYDLYRSQIDNKHERRANTSEKNDWKPNTIINTVLQTECGMRWRNHKAYMICYVNLCSITLLQVRMCYRMRNRFVKNFA